MGNKASNVSTILASISDYIAQNTYVNSIVISEQNFSIIIQNCQFEIQGNADFSTGGMTMMTISQFVNTSINNIVKNSIKQKLLQTAQADANILSLGSAKASSAISNIAQNSDSIINGIYDILSKYQYNTLSNTCQNSFFRTESLSINQMSTSNFISHQLSNYTGNNNIFSQINQQLSQQSKTGVKGISTGFMFMALVVAAIGVLSSKLLDNPAYQLYFILFVIIGLLSIILWAYYDKLPPFFSDPPLHIIKGKNLACNQFADVRNRTIDMTSPPTRYNLDLVGVNSLLSMIVPKLSDQFINNGGYNLGTKKYIDTIIQTYQQYADQIGVSNIPNPLKTYSSNLYILPQYCYNQTNPQRSTDDDTIGVCTPMVVQYDNSVINPQIDTACFPPSSSGFVIVNPDTLGISVSTVDINTIANDNSLEWNTYLNTDGVGADTRINRAKFARFILADILEIDTNVYIEPDEYVKQFSSDGVSVDLARNVNWAYQYIPSINYNFTQAIQQNDGTLTGQFGYCYDNKYKYIMFMKHYGIYLILLIITVLLGSVIYKIKRKADNVIDKIQSLLTPK